MVLAVICLFCDGMIISTLQFFRKYLAKVSLKKTEKNKSSYNFSFFLHKNKELFVKETKFTNFTAIF